VRPTGASIKIKQIRDVISEVHKKPFESGFKVVIFEEAEKMTVDAQDAFLKTLEEPPANTVFMLLAENQHTLLQTVLSRCQVFPVRPVPVAEVEAYLRKNYKTSDEQIKLASIYSNGIIGRAVQMLKDDYYFVQRQKYFDIFGKARGGSFPELSVMASEAIDNKQQALEFTEYLLSLMRDILVYKELNRDSEGIISNIDKITEIAYYSGVLTEKQVSGIIDTIKSTIKYISHNVSIKNSIDGMLMNILEVTNGKDDRSQVQKGRQDLLLRS
jgi:DNA polymerase-3 subunit delta'